MVSHPPNHEHFDNQMVKMEVNLDDISGEWLGYVMDLLFEAGANDVFYTPIYMKKNRPGILLQLLCSKKKVSRMKEILFKETTTLGLRYFPLTVHRLERSFVKIETEWGPVTIKEGIHEGQIVQRAPEYEDCRQIAEQHGIPLKKVYEQVWKAVQ
ncbi:LarC family nickel insertion protein [Bacillus sp. FJAT-29790]|uniref:nickel insertion protein n=1 Tax=Bacillus sp. FJAT-29790 TaxID=1895002 RepID=UPI001C250E7B|nr:nickel insertion protein [Bacillus sp. FJAT-29790]MBU8880718.1 LarC family nickel insertion protein [Bacillus sp. FJAT-29790]